MKKYFETVTTRTQKWYRIFEETENGDYTVVNKNASKEEIEGLSEAFKESGIMATLRTGGKTIKVNKSNYIVDSKRDGAAVIAATKSFK